MIYMFYITILHTEHTYIYSQIIAVSHWLISIVLHVEESTYLL